MRINCKTTESGLMLTVDDAQYTLDYAPEIWKKYPENLKNVFRDNFAFLKAIHLPQMLEKDDPVDFGTATPLFKESIYNCMLNNISFCADVDESSTSGNLKNFLNLKFRFKDYRPQMPDYKEELDEKAVVNFSFGKDSLLTYAVADEIGLDPEPVYMADHAVKLENAYKKIISEKFSKEFNKNISVIENQTGLIHDYRHWKRKRTEWGYGHLMTEFFFDSLPIVNSMKSKYILYGNEKSCDDNYLNKEGYASYPVFDQSSNWLIELDKIAKTINKDISVSSLIEPIYELGIMKILHNRYPEIGKYQMSCFPDENEYGKAHYWCEHCSKCARIFIFMKANGLDPKSVGFKTDMLALEHKRLYSCFGLEKKEGVSVGYDASGMGRDEQLYAFYLSYRNGVKGDLIEEFKKYLLGEAKEREEEFHKKFYGIHNSKTIPQKFIAPVKSIYAEELSKN